ncbi:unnamed protein product [Linum trigynum]|uniref:Uncharacterized protein n=1 Tax=Linum trigynum TaxID=586398 RepID=A0AAV2E726_9ROSI
MDPINNGEEETRKKEISRCSIDVHKVAPPPQRSSLEKLKSRLKETFFPDDPLRQFKGQPSAMNGTTTRTRLSNLELSRGLGRSL